MNLRAITSMLALAALSVIDNQVSTSVAQGSLTPPVGAPAPVMKSLDQIEARTPVNSLPGSSNAMHVISAPGSYYLTGPVSAVSGKGGIRIEANQVVLDLNGFTLEGADSNPGNGIFSSGSVSNFTVRGGIIRRWNRGIQFYNSRSMHVESLQISNCGGDAIYIVGGGIIRNVVTTDTALGIAAFGTNGWLVKDCVVSNVRPSYNNSITAAIWAGFGRVESCTVKNFRPANGGGEIHGIDAPVVKGCVVDGITADESADLYIFGIYADVADGCLVENISGKRTWGYLCDQVENSRAQNIVGTWSAYGIITKEKVSSSRVKSISGSFGTGISGQSIESCTVDTVSGAGFQAYSSIVNCTVQSATFSGSGYGIYCTTAGVRIEGNTVRNCDTGIRVTAAGSAVIRNTARGNSTNYLVHASSVCPVATAVQAATATNPLINLSL